MTTSALETTVSSNLNELWHAAEPHQSRIGIALLLAFAAHLGFGLWAPEHAPAAPLAPRVVEVEFAQREPPPPPPPKVLEPEPPSPAPAPVNRHPNQPAAPPKPASPPATGASLKFWNSNPRAAA